MKGWKNSHYSFEGQTNQGGLRFQKFRGVISHEKNPKNIF